MTVKLEQDIALMDQGNDEEQVGGSEARDHM